MWRLGSLLRDPGALGLLEAARQRLKEPEREARGQGGRRSELEVEDRSIRRRELGNQGLMETTVEAMNTLENNGHVTPYVCVYGQRPFQEAHSPVGDSTAFPRDRLEPLIGRELLHASAIDIVPLGTADDAVGERWTRRGLLLSLADDAVDLAIATQATPEFMQVDAQGRYLFSVFERFALRIKDPSAMVYLEFEESERGRRAGPTRP
jgi:hypothetical protein